MNNSISRLSELDWDFPGDSSDSPFSDLHFHPGRFVPQIPAALIGSLTSPGQCVLDPFCGSGTTLVEAQRLGRSAVGIDLNPVSCLVSRAKTLPLCGDEVEFLLLDLINRLTTAHLESNRSQAMLLPTPTGVQLSKWYHAETGEQLRQIWSFIKSQEDLLAQDLLLFCFSAALLNCCSENRSWGYVCDNVRPLELRYVDAFMVFREKAESLIGAYRRRDKRWLIINNQLLSPLTVKEGDAASQISELSSDSIDLVVTSPPYFGVVDYIKSQRLTLEWLSLNTEPLRLIETGARSKRHRKTALMEYSSELEKVVKQLHRVIKPGRILGMVMGESTKREASMMGLTELLTSVGFTVELTINREIGKRRRQPASLQSELLFIAKKQ